MHTPCRRTVHGTWRRLTLCLTAAAMLLASCGELFDVDEDGGTGGAVAMKIDRDTVYIMQGESLRLSVTFSPVAPANTGVLWLSQDAGIARMNADTLVAVSQGNTVVTAMSADGLRPDTCVVSVMKPWTVRAADFFFDTVVYADISVGGRTIGDDLEVGAFVGGELRGKAQLREAHGKRYAEIRVYGPDTASAADTITFCCYDHRNVLLRRFGTTLPFDGETHGTLSQLVKLTME